MSAVFGGVVRCSQKTRLVGVTEASGRAAQEDAVLRRTGVELENAAHGSLGTRLRQDGPRTRAIGGPAGGDPPEHR